MAASCETAWVLVLWDFDGTLATRRGMWSGAVIEALDDDDRDHGITTQQIRDAMRSRYPWDAWQEPHPQLCERERWWSHVEGVIAQALERAGLALERAPRVARAARERYLDTSRAWTLFDDALPALDALAQRGWRSAILSNHVPELPDLVAALGLDARVEAVFSSALTGYEKPHPEAFRLALRECGNPSRAWMVGDNPTADVDGARAVGLPAILVRAGEGLDAAAERILSSDA